MGIKEKLRERFFQIMLHTPHPGNIVKAYVMKQVYQVLKFRKFGYVDIQLFTVDSFKNVWTIK